MAYIALFVKHPHGRMTVIDPLDPHTEPPEVPPTVGRRPVVALVDAAVGAHPWLAEPTMLAPLSFTVAEDLGSPQDQPEQPEANQAPVTEHGTFDAGVIRQLAPGAVILSASVLGDDHTIAHADVLAALTALHDRFDGTPETFVDVVCLPFGYFEADASADHVTAEENVLRELAASGILVVAAAGNDGTGSEVFPAAFAPRLMADNHAMLSVGALDVTGRPAAYSNHGAWVTTWEIGLTTSIVAEPADGYAVGEGTSFAAARVAAKLAALLSEDPTLGDVTAEAAADRARRAVARLS